MSARGCPAFPYGHPGYELLCREPGVRCGWRGAGAIRALLRRHALVLVSALLLAAVCVADAATGLLPVSLSVAADGSANLLCPV